MDTLLDTDLYKLTMMQAVWLRQPTAQARYRFINRRPSQHFTETCVARLRERVHAICQVKITPDELEFLGGLGLFQREFLAYLKDFILQEADIDLQLVAGQLRIEIDGHWVRTILWEVPLMAAISECYFEAIDIDWDHDLDAYFEQALAKGKRLTDAGCAFVEFGTRRRRSYAIQNAVVRAFKADGVDCVGTSNVHFAMKYGMQPIGTMAHEWIMAYAGIVGVANANQAALRAWRTVYGDQLDTALTDTYTTELFFNDIRGELARQFGALRHDSQCPFVFLENVIEFYQEEGIDPRTKRIVFSDGLDVDKALEVKARAAGRIPVAFGIGTHFTNDFAGSRALNMVVKLFAINGRPVAKISDNPTKACGESVAIQEALKAIEAARVTA